MPSIPRNLCPWPSNSSNLTSAYSGSARLVYSMGTFSSLSPCMIRTGPVYPPMMPYMSTDAASVAYLLPTVFPSISNVSGTPFATRPAIIGLMLNPG